MAPRHRGRHVRRHTAVGLFVGTPLVSLLALQTPVLTLVVAGVVSLGIAALTSPSGFVTGAAFLTSAVPKAGIVVGGLPLPVMMFVLIMSAVMLRVRTRRERNPGHRLALMAILWLIYRMVALYLNGGTLANVAALAGWYGLPILLLLVGPALGSLPVTIGKKWISGLENGILLASSFSLVQQFLGLERTAVPGITRAVGVDYSSKPLAFEGGSKIPSTYQNGNILGAVTAMFFLIATDHVLRGRATRRDKLLMGATAVATILSGSRTAVIGLALGLGILMVRAGLRRKTLAIVAGCVLVVGLTLQLSPALSRRLTGTSASDPAVALRTDIWSAVLNQTSVLDLLVGGSAWAHPLEPPGLAEGMIGAVQQVGIIGMTLFVVIFLTATSPLHLRRWRLYLIPIGFSLAVDSAYLVFPTLFLPIARMFGLIDRFEIPSAEDQGPGPSVRDLETTPTLRRSPQ